MGRLPAPLACLWITLSMPILAHATPEQSGQSDCKQLINHSGFAEFVLPSEGGTQKLPIKAGPSIKWTIRNSDYVDWIDILDGDSGAGPGTMTIRVEANTRNACRVGILTIVGVQPIYGSLTRIGSPIRIIQRGAGTADAAGNPESPHPSVITLAPISSSNPQSPGSPEYKKIAKKK